MCLKPNYKNNPRPRIPCTHLHNIPDNQYKMEYYDVIIIGAGIAGCGLAYNLKRIGYKGSVLVIDKEGIGANAANGYRNTFKEIIEEYNLPYAHKFKGLKLGNHEETLATIHHDFYFVNYEKICEHLLINSNQIFRKEAALDICKNTIRTNKNIYKFKYIIDASGASFFLRRILRLQMPFKYFIGKLKTFQMENKPHNTEYFSYKGDPKGYIEDFHMIKNELIQGDWQLSDDTDFRKIRSPPYSELNKLEKEPKLIKQSYVVEPVSPVFPIATTNYAFIGDSFGNATSSVGEGIRPILDSSKMLAKAIRAGHLKTFEKEWKEKYLKSYLFSIASRVRLKDRFEILKLIKNDQELLLKTIRNENATVPLHILRKFPKKLLISTIYNYVKLKILYFKVSLNKQPQL